MAPPLFGPSPSRLIAGECAATLSVCIITRNEEHNLPRCLASVEGLASQIVVVDSGSTDRTCEIAIAAKAQIWRRVFDGYGNQKAFAFGKATADWILGLDADEWLDEDLRASIREVLRTPVKDSRHGYYVNRQAFYLGEWIAHSGWAPEWKLRLIRRGCGQWSRSAVHERLEVSGRTARLTGRLCHFPYRDLSHHLQTIDDYTNILAASAMPAARGRLLFGVAVEPSLVLLQKLFLQRGFLDGTRGLIVSTLTAYYFLFRYAKQWECRLKAQQSSTEA
jgi:glycosyltransferase involved in cell wall biosynthesis